jgi:hypothetical protein
MPSQGRLGNVEGGGQKKSEQSSAIWHVTRACIATKALFPLSFNYFILTIYVLNQNHVLKQYDRDKAAKLNS